MDSDISTSIDIGSDLGNEKKKDEILKEQKKLADKHRKKRTKAKTRVKKQEKTKKEKSIKRYLPVIFITAAMLLSVLIRLHYASIPVTYDWASYSANVSLRPQIAEAVDKQYYFYSDQQKNEIINEQLKDALTKYKSSIEEKSDELKQSFKDPNGNTYLYGIDPYKYYKDAKDKNFSNFLSFFSYYLYRFVSLFNNNATLMQTSFYIPVIFVCLSIIPIYLIARRITGDYGAFVASAVFAIHPEFLKYSLAGMSDTNTLNVFFLLLIAWLFLELFYLKSFKTRIIAAVSIIAALFLFKFTWTGYYLAAGLISGGAIVFFGIYLFRLLTAKLSMKKRILSLAILFMVIFIFAFFGQNFIISLLPQKIQLYLGRPAEQGIWPVNLSSVTELKQIAFSEMLFRIGGSFLAIIVLFFIGYTTLRILRQKHEIIKADILCIVAAIVIVVAGMKALRILPFAIPFVCIIFGSGFIIIYQWLARTFIRWTNLKSNVMRYFTFMLVFALLMTPIAMSFSENYKSVRVIRPKMDDSLYNNAIDIKMNSEENAQIFCWWDKGHFFNAISDRSVFEKASPAMPMTYWMARALVTPDENLARGIIRMLSCDGENTAFNKITKEYSNYEAIQIMDHILAINRTAAAEYLESMNITPDTVLQYTHCQPKQTFVVVTDDMFTRFHSVLYYANWDPRVGEIRQEVQGMDINSALGLIEQKYNLTSSQANDLYLKATTNENPYSAFMQYNCNKENSTFVCSVGRKSVAVNIDTLEMNFKPIPKKLVVIDGNITTYNFESESDKVMIIYKRGGNYQTIMVDETIADSMYIKLMLFDGKGLDDFQLFRDYSRPETMRVASYIVKWDQANKQQ